jgi:hypothetical protein
MAAVVLALFAPIAMVHIQLDTTEAYQIHKLQEYNPRKRFCWLSAVSGAGFAPHVQVSA